jgi:ABC-type nitrate/sulfonate/bicarbonate transport system permease component
VTRRRATNGRGRTPNRSAESGLGVALIAARATADSARVWGIAVVATAVAGLGYALIALAGRVLTPWASASQRSEP